MPADETASTSEPTIIEVWHTSGGVVALLSSGEMVRLFRANAMVTALAHLDDDLRGLTLAAASGLASKWSAFLLPEGDVVPE